MLSLFPRASHGGFLILRHYSDSARVQMNPRIFYQHPKDLIPIVYSNTLRVWWNWVNGGVSLTVTISQSFKKSPLLSVVDLDYG